MRGSMTTLRTYSALSKKLVLPAKAWTPNPGGSHAHTRRFACLFKEPQSFRDSAFARRTQMRSRLRWNSGA